MRFTNQITQISRTLLVAGMMLLSLVHSGCGYEGEAPFSDDGCDQVILDHLVLPDGLTSSSWYYSAATELEFVNQTGKVLPYNRANVYKTQYDLESCGPTFSSDRIKSTYKTEFLSPDLFTEAYNVSWNGGERTHMPYLRVGVGKFSALIRADSMILQNFKSSTYYSHLDTMGASFDSCYLFSRIAELDSDVEFILYSHHSGILGYQLKNGFYWRQK